ncbi:MAG: sodium-dependent transporter [Bacteroidaceae bacterium]|nr:sodium-dependent transporter [Bacteroidaceae bacterium]
METRHNFGSKIGAVLASAGSAVGLGNVWRVPTEVGNNGGAAFIFVYLICIAVIGIPVMMSEFLIGRNTHANTITAFSKLAPGKWWRLEGVAGVFVAFLILSYYIIVSGWTLFYLIQSVGGRLMADRDYSLVFNDFVSNPWQPVLAGVAFMGLTHYIIARGVQSGIERFSKLMMPMLLFIIGILVVCSFSMPGSREGLRFLLKPDFSKITGSVLLSAVGQAFYSLSLAMGCLCTYASYFRQDTNLPKTAAGVSTIDTFVAILSGFIIFPAVFSVEGVSVDAGPGLVFITLPNVFNIAFSHIPLLGYFFSGFFYLLLLLAALTSAMSLHESVTAYLLEAFHLSRKKAAATVSVACMTLGVACSLSFGVLSGLKVFGLNIFELFDYTSSKIILPIGGIIICLFTGWYLDRKLVENELTNGGTLRFRLFRLYYFLIRYVAPIAITAVFVREFLA